MGNEQVACCSGVPQSLCSGDTLEVVNEKRASVDYDGYYFQKSTAGTSRTHRRPSMIDNDNKHASFASSNKLFSDSFMNLHGAPNYYPPPLSKRLDIYAVTKI